MPYLKRPDIPFIEMRRLILGYGYNGEQLATILNCSPDAARRRLKDPEKFSLGDLKKICKNGHIPAEALREAIHLN